MDQTPFTFPEQAEPIDLNALKEKLREFVVPERMSGRGAFGPSPEVFEKSFDSRALKALNSEYSEFLWGDRPLARNSELCADEEKIIHDYTTGVEEALEVGCGSGRITHHLRKNVKHLMATDVVPGVIRSAQEKHTDFKNVMFLVDDITRSQLPEAAFDLVMFWENGLGAILYREERHRALMHMARVLRPGGLLILALRKIPESPCPHIMVTPQDAQKIGVYFTFTVNEILSILPSSLRHIRTHLGFERPAGGEAFFMIFQK